jgi:hypothetical protein
MRPVVLQMGVTLDGFVHGAKGYRTGDFRQRTTRSWRGRSRRCVKRARTLWAG